VWCVCVCVGVCVVCVCMCGCVCVCVCVCAIPPDRNICLTNVRRNILESTFVI